MMLSKSLDGNLEYCLEFVNAANPRIIELSAALTVIELTGSVLHILRHLCTVYCVLSLIIVYCIERCLHTVFIPVEE